MLIFKLSLNYENLNVKIDNIIKNLLIVSISRFLNDLPQEHF